MNAHAFCLTAAMLLFSCAKHVQVKAPLHVEGDGWRADRVNKDSLMVIALDKESAKRAKTELCDPSKFICTVQTIESFVVQRKEK